jgi:hypothetical protein
MGLVIITKWLLLTNQVEVYWDERQHYMAGHTARRIRDGATRNLVVRFAKPSMTPDSIREDLEHIHNLDVVDIKLENGHAYVSTNGISWAVTAKSCMASRLKYKGTRIDFYPDECDEPLPPVVKKPRPPPNQPKKVPSVPHKNRFALLSEDDEELEDGELA